MRIFNSKKHQVHKYQKINIGKKKDWWVYKCVLPNCSHHVEVALAFARLSICHVCGETFQMTKGHLTMVKPLCNECREKRKQAVKAMRELPRLSELEGSLYEDGQGAEEANPSQAPGKDFVGQE